MKAAGVWAGVDVGAAKGFDVAVLDASGLAAALKARTADGRPLFDYWIDVEGVDHWWLCGPFGM